MVTHSSIFAWKIPEGQRNMAGYSAWDHRVKHDSATEHAQSYKNLDSGVFLSHLKKKKKA